MGKYFRYSLGVLQSVACKRQDGEGCVRWITVKNEKTCFFDRGRSMGKVELEY